MPVESVSSLSDQDLQDELCAHVGAMSVAEARLLELIGELDSRDAWGVWGMRSCAHWLSWRLGTSLATAREQIRVARALRRLPLVRGALARGEISYSKARAITRIATPEIEPTLVEWAGDASASQLEAIVRNYRRVEPDEADRAGERHRRRYLHHWTDEDGSVVISARLAPEDGATVLAAIGLAQAALAEAPTPDRPARPDVSAETSTGSSTGTGPTTDWTGASDAGGVSAETSLVDPVEVRDHSQADALVLICESLLRAGVGWGSESSPAHVLVHLDAATAADPEAPGCSHVEGVGAIAAHTAARLACDAAVSNLVFHPDGGVQPEGSTRVVPARLRRAVRARDRGCRWPGCSQVRFVDVHHVKFVSRGGRTTMSNLVCLCRHHHRLVHEGGFRLDMPSPGVVSLAAPDGAAIPEVPPAPGPPRWELERLLAEAGVQVDPSTLLYGGERFSMADAIQGLLGLAAGADRAGSDQAPSDRAEVAAGA